MTANPLEILKTVYGYDAFRGPQARIVDHIIAGNNAFVLMPTGGGKSLCYQIPAIVRPGMGLIVSPLLALMADQVAALRQAGVKAAALNSDLGPDERRALWNAVETGALDLLYVAPETLAAPGRPAAARGGEAVADRHRRGALPVAVGPRLPAFLSRSSTAGPAVSRHAAHRTDGNRRRADQRRDRRASEIAPADAFIAGFDRPNIRYAIEEKDNPRAQLMDFLKRYEGESGIVYCLSKRKTEETAAWLRDQGYDALAYHAGMEKAARETNQQRFQHGEAVIMVATIAFGMGIDKPDVRFVAHLDLPASIEAYYQETGPRRSRRPAVRRSHALRLRGRRATQPLHRGVRRARRAQAHGAAQARRAAWGLAETAGCRRQVLLSYFGDDCEPCGNCDTCAQPPKMFDGTTAAQKALSCIYRTGERFGQAYVVDVLLGGSRTTASSSSATTSVSTFGIGTEHDNRTWRAILRQLIALRLIGVDLAGHGGLSIAPAGRDFLRDKPTLMLRVPTAPRARRNKATQSAAQSALPERDRDLFQALRQKRTEIARLQSVPPYVIFHDKTLIELAAARPASRDEMADVPGVGEAKLDRYGPAFLSVIAEHA